MRKALALVFIGCLAIACSPSAEAAPEASSSDDAGTGGDPTSCTIIIGFDGIRELLICVTEIP